MPPKPPKPCNHPGCRALTLDRYCEKHREQNKKVWENKRHVPRMTGRALQRERERLFRLQPICAICGQAPSTVRDHIISLLEGGTDTRENAQGVCKRCHNRKTGQEAQRGRRK